MTDHPKYQKLVSDPALMEELRKHSGAKLGRDVTDEEVRTALDTFARSPEQLMRLGATPCPGDWASVIKSLESKFVINCEIPLPTRPSPRPSPKPSPTPSPKPSPRQA